MSSIEMIPKPLASLDQSKHEQDFSLVHSSHHERRNSHAELLEEADDPDFYVGQAMLVEEPEVDPVVLKKPSSRRSLWKKQKSEKKSNSNSRRGSRTAGAVAEASPKKTLSPISVMEFMNSSSPNNHLKNNSKHNKRSKGGSQHSRGRKSEYQQIDQANDTMEHHTERQLRRYSNTNTTTTTKSKSQRSLTSTNKSPSSLHSIDLDELDHITNNNNNNNNGDIMSETESFLASTHEEDAEKIQQIQRPIIASSSDSLIESLWTQKKQQQQPSSFSNDSHHHHHNNNKTLQRHSYHHRSTAFLDSEDDTDFFRVSHHPRRPRARSEGHVFDAVFPDDFAAEFVAQAKQEAKEKKQRRKSKKIKKSAKTTKRTKPQKKSKNRKSSKSHKSKSYQPDHSESAATDELNLVEEIVRAVQAEDDDEYYYEEEVVDEQIVPDDDDDDDEESHTGWEDQDEQSIDEDELENDITTTHSTSLQESSSSFASAFSELYQVIQDCKTAPQTGEHSESSTTASMTLSDKSLHSQKSTKSKKSRSKQRDNKKAPRRSKSEHSRQSPPRSKSTSSSKKKVKRSKSHHDVLASSSKHGRRSRDKELNGLSDRQHAKLLHRLERKLVKLEAKLHRTEKELIDTKRADAVIINGLQETVHSQQARMKEQQSELVKTRGALDSLRKQQQQQMQRRDFIPGVPQRQGSGNYEDSTDSSPPRRRSVVHLLDSLVDDERSNDGTVNLLPQNSTHKHNSEQDDMPGLDDVTSLEAAAYESEEEDLVFVLQSIDRKVDTLLDNSDLASVEDLDEQISTMSKELKRVSPAKKQVSKHRKSRRSAAAPTPVLTKDEKIHELYSWYNRYGSCSKKTLKGTIRKMGPSCGMEPNDVNLLPWIGQNYIDAKAMKDLLIVKGK